MNYLGPLFVFLVLGTNTEAFSNVIGKELRRIKRQDAGGDFRGGGFGMDGENRCAGVCFFSFIAVMASSPAAEKLESKDEAKSLFTFINEEFITELCPGYKNLKTCLSGCPTKGSFFEEGPEAAFTALDFICVDNYEEVLEYLPCYTKANKTITETCDIDCDGASTIEAVSDLDEFEGDPEDIPEVLDLMNTMCGYMQCLGDCQQPIIEEQCGSSEPAIFVRRFIRHFLTGAMAPLLQLGLPQIVPEKCKAITSDEYVPASNKTVKKETLEFSSDIKDVNELEVTKLQLELMVLEKQKEKIALETEVLLLEKNFYSIDNSTSDTELLIAAESIEQMRVEIIKQEYEIAKQRSQLIDALIENLKLKKKYYTKSAN